MAKTHYKPLGKENSSDKYCVIFQDFSKKINKSQDFPRHFSNSRAFRDLWEPWNMILFLTSFILHSFKIPDSHMYGWSFGNWDKYSPSEVSLSSVPLFHILKHCLSVQTLTFLWWNLFYLQNFVFSFLSYFTFYIRKLLVRLFFEPNDVNDQKLLLIWVTMPLKEPYSKFCKTKCFFCKQISKFMSFRSPFIKVILFQSIFKWGGWQFVVGYTLQAHLCYLTFIIFIS